MNSTQTIEKLRRDNRQLAATTVNMSVTALTGECEREIERRMGDEKARKTVCLCPSFQRLSLPLPLSSSVSVFLSVPFSLLILISTSLIHSLSLSHPRSESERRKGTWTSTKTTCWWSQESKRKISMVRTWLIDGPAMLCCTRHYFVCRIILW